MPDLSRLAADLRVERMRVHRDMGRVVEVSSEKVAALVRQNAVEGGVHTRRTRTPAVRPGGPAKITGKGSQSFQAKQFPTLRIGVWRARVTFNRDGFYMQYVENAGYKFFRRATDEAPRIVAEQMRRRFGV